MKCAAGADARQDITNKRAKTGPMQRGKGIGKSDTGREKVQVRSSQESARMDGWMEKLAEELHVDESQLENYIDPNHLIS